jgi:acyl carrier protein
MTMLSQRLPTAMMPAAIVILSELPRLPNQKVDRKRLADIDAQRAAASSEAVEDPMIRAVATVFEKVLGYSASAEDNVLTLGGDSVQAIAIALELEDRFDIEIPIDEFQATQSIRELADWIAVRRREETASAARA